MLDGGNVIACLKQRRSGAGVEPPHAAAEQLHVQFIALKIKQIQVGDLEFAACRWAQRPAKIDDLIIVNVKPRHSERTFRLLGLFFEANGFAFRVELDHAIALRVANLIAENARAPLESERLAIKIEFPRENVVAKDERRARIADEFRAD